MSLEISEFNAARSREWLAARGLEETPERLLTALLAVSGVCPLPFQPGEKAVELLARYHNNAKLMAEKFFPFDYDDETDTVAVFAATPWNVLVADAAKQGFNPETRVLVFYARPTDIEAFLKESVRVVETSSEDLQQHRDSVGIADAKQLDATDTKGIMGEWSRCLESAVRQHATDIQFGPSFDGKNYEMAFRIFNEIRMFKNYSLGEGRTMNNVLMNQTSSMKPERIIYAQDGAMRGDLVSIGLNVGFRLAALPCEVDGSKERHVHMTIRVQDPTRNKLVTLESVFSDHEDLEGIKRTLDSSGVLVFMAGPTGSGKTTTLGAMMRYLTIPGNRTLYSVEDPVENQIPGVTAISAGPSTPISFADALRSLLRKKPDVIMVGEVRDREVASVASEAARTGHTVLTTIHADNASDIPQRLFQMGVEPWMVADRLRLCVSQRMVKIIDKTKAEAFKLPEELCKAIGIPLNHAGTTVYRRRNENGKPQPYVGIVAITETLLMEKELRRAVGRAEWDRFEDASAEALKGRSLRDKMIGLFLAGKTDLEAIPEAITRI